ncbi:MAG: hypothetical protein WBP08_06685 [Saprospiraceae bacterium]|nr:hypothetical protein [Saprospiraceae bacterium]
MKKSLIQICILSMSVILVLGCRSNKRTQNTVEYKPSLISFLDSTTAAKAIIDDDSDGLYDQISKIEIEIQMKKEKPFSNRDDALMAYKKFMAREVSPWQPKERDILLDVFQIVKKLCDTLSPRLFPGGIQLIKVKTNHYGEDVYYTGNHNIFIPENIFPIKNEEALTSVMTHEVFHILSRYNPELKHALYQLIGFQKAKKPVRLNEVLNKKLLTNPDGVSYQYVIGLDSILAIPLITSKLSSYQSSKPAFFDYLNFDLYRIQDIGAYYEAVSDEAGNTTIPLKSTPEFFRKIKDNTRYVIHPDEIMADNFMLALQAYSSNDYSKFTKEGRELIDNILKEIEKF